MLMYVYDTKNIFCLRKKREKHALQKEDGKYIINSKNCVH